MEQDKIEQDTSKFPTHLNDTDHTHATPPPPKKRYEIMKDPVFLSSPIYPPFISSNPSLSRNRDDHLIPLLSHDDCIFKAQLTSLYMHPTDYSFRLYDKNQDCFTSIASKIIHTNIGLIMASKSFLCNFELHKGTLWHIF